MARATRQSTVKKEPVADNGTVHQTANITPVSTNLSYSRPISIASMMSPTPGAELPTSNQNSSNASVVQMASSGDTVLDTDVLLGGVSRNNNNSVHAKTKGTNGVGPRRNGQTASGMFCSSLLRPEASTILAPVPCCMFTSPTGETSRFYLPLRPVHVLATLPSFASR